MNVELALFVVFFVFFVSVVLFVFGVLFVFAVLFVFEVLFHSAKLTRSRYEAFSADRQTIVENIRRIAAIYSPPVLPPSSPFLCHIEFFFDVREKEQILHQISLSKLLTPDSVLSKKAHTLITFLPSHKSEDDGDTECLRLMLIPLVLTRDCCCTVEGQISNPDA